MTPHQRSLLESCARDTEGLERIIQILRDCERNAATDERNECIGIASLLENEYKEQTEAANGNDLFLGGCLEGVQAVMARLYERMNDAK